MIKIKVTILSAGIEEFPRCSDLLDMCPEIAILAQPTSVVEAGALLALERGNVLILDEAIISQEGANAIRGLLLRYPLIQSLLVLEKHNENNILPALSLGIQGVVTRDSLPAILCRAVAALYTGEAWIPRGLVEPLRDEVIGFDRQAYWTGQSKLYLSH